MVHCMKYSMACVLLTLLLSLAAAHDQPEMVLYEGDECVTSNYDGRCLVEKQCSNLEAVMTQKGLYPRDVGHCGYTVYEEIICCPEDIINRPLSRKYFQTTEIRSSITLIITSTTIIQTEKIGDDLIFSNFTNIH